MRVTWIAPFNQGAAISNYQVMIQDSSNTFLIEASCSGTNLYCDVPIADLIASPYSLVKGNEVIAKVAA